MLIRKYLVNALKNKVNERRHVLSIKLIEGFDENLVFILLFVPFLHPFLEIGLILEILGVDIDHAAARNGRRRCILQIKHLI